MKLFTSSGSRNARAFKLASIGLTLLMVTALILVSDPVQIIVNWQMALKPGTLFYTLWLKPPIDVYISIYMFNITNADAFLSGADSKIKLQEIGPYVYQEFLEYRDVYFNENNTVTYRPERSTRFVPERSKGDPKTDKVIAANVPYLGISTVAASFSFLAAYGITTIAKQLDAGTIVEKTVEEYLWGYDDRLVQLASKVLPSVFDFNRFGIMDRILNEGKNVITMKLPDPEVPPTKHINKTENVQQEEKVRSFAVDNWNGEKGLKLWDYDESLNQTSTCNTVRGVFDGTLFPRDLKKGETIRLYRKAFCRTLPITYSHEDVLDGVHGYVFKLKSDAFDSNLDNPETACFCKAHKCLKRGLSNVSPCYYNMPLAISFPHFYNADPTLIEPFEGLNGNEEKHNSEMVVQPVLGVPMRVKSRFQVNLLVGDIKSDRNLRRFRNMVLPIFWTEIAIDHLSTILSLLIKSLFTYFPYAQLGLCIVLIIVGITMVGKAMVLQFWAPEAWNQLPNISTKDGVPVEMGTLKGLTILPMIKQTGMATPAELSLQMLRRGSAFIRDKYESCDPSLEPLKSSSDEQSYIV